MFVVLAVFLLCSHAHVLPPPFLNLLTTVDHQPFSRYGPPEGNLSEHFVNLGERID